MMRRLLRVFIRWEIILVVIPCVAWWLLLGGLYLMPRPPAGLLAACFVILLFVVNITYFYIPSMIAPSLIVVTDLGGMPSGPLGWLLAIVIYSAASIVLTLFTCVVTGSLKKGPQNIKSERISNSADTV